MRDSCLLAREQTHTAQAVLVCLTVGAGGRAGQSISCLERFRRGLRLFFITLWRAFVARMFPKGGLSCLHGLRFSMDFHFPPIADEIMIT